MILGGLLSLIVQAASPPVAGAPRAVTRFELVAATDQTVSYIDPQMISTIDAGFYGYNELQIPREALAPVKGVVPSHVLTFIQLRCATSEAKRIVSIFYGPDGKELMQALISEPYEPYEVNTLRGGEAAFVCGTARKGAASVPPGTSMLSIAHAAQHFWATHPLSP